MPEAPVEKHKGEEGKNLLESCKISADFGNGIACRNETVDIDKFIQPSRLGILIKKNDNIDTDDGIVHNRVIFSRDGVTQGDHFLPKLQSATSGRAKGMKQITRRRRICLRR